MDIVVNLVRSLIRKPGIVLPCLVVYLVVFFSSIALPQIKKSEVTAYPLKAMAVGEYPYVYETPDFNAPILVELKRGQIYSVSEKKSAQLFYKIFVRAGIEGYVSDAEIKMVKGALLNGVNLSNQKINKPLKYSQKPSHKSINSAEKRNDNRKNIINKPFYAQKYRGLIVESSQYTENTMGKTRSENLTFIGFRVTGYDTLFSGEMATDTSVMLYPGAPSYYKSVTGHEAKGWILHSSFTFDTYLKRSKYFLVSYGFGPMAKLSHFVASLNKDGSNKGNGSSVDYPMDDFTLGILLRLGVGFRINKVSLRSDIKYYIEKERYFAANLSTLYEF